MFLTIKSFKLGERRNIVRKRIGQLARPSSPNEHDQTSDLVSGVKCEKQLLPEREWSPERDDRFGAAKMDGCYLLNKTLSMNDDLAREMEKYLEEQSSAVTSTVGSGRLIVETTPLLDVGPDEVQSKYIAESACSTSLRKGGKYSYNFDNDVQSSLDGFESLGSSKNLDVQDGICRDNMGQTRGKRPSNDNKSYGIANRKDDRPSAANWNELRKFFAYLQRLNRKIRGEDTKCASLFSRYSFARSDRRFRYVSMTTPPRSSSRITLSCESLSPKNSKNYKSFVFASRNATQPTLTNERRSKLNESPQRAKKIEQNPVSINH